jgi:RNA polymerase sigma factor (TIGR02999 family)
MAHLSANRGRMSLEMFVSHSTAITVLLNRIRQGDEAATQDLVVELYEQFRQRAHLQMRNERPGHTLGATALAHEALMRLWKGAEFTKAATSHQLFAAFARAMRQTLIDHARCRKAERRGGGIHREELDHIADSICQKSGADVLLLNEALARLQAELPEVATILEMRFYGGYLTAEIADALNSSVRTVERHTRFGLAWLNDFLTHEGGDVTS